MQSKVIDVRLAGVNTKELRDITVAMKIAGVLILFILMLGGFVTAKLLQQHPRS